MPQFFTPPEAPTPGTITHPYTNLTGGRWMKGNLHAHTNNSDGKISMQAVVDIYAQKKHDFLMISDHDVWTSAEDHAKLDSKGLVLIPGNEISRFGPHLLHVGAERFVPPHMPRQRVINEVADAGGFVVVPHPNWQERFNHTSIEQLTEWTGYVGMEIYNGVIGRLDGSPYATNKWDMLLAAGRTVWGFANDDSHNPDFNDYSLGWNMVYVTDPTPAGILQAMRQGRFYASTGVEITDIRVTGNTIRIETANARRIVALRQIGKRFAQADSNVLEVEIHPQASYVRFECWGEGEQFAWTQPIFHTPFPAPPKGK